MADSETPTPFRTRTLRELLADDLSERERQRKEARDIEAARLLQSDEELTIEIRTSETDASAYIGNVEVGRVEWSTTDLSIERIEVHPGLRRRGIATALWHAVRDAGIALRHDNQRTTAGAAWAEAVSGADAGPYEPCDDWYEPLWVP